MPTGLGSRPPFSSALCRPVAYRQAPLFEPAVLPRRIDDFGNEQVGRQDHIGFLYDASQPGGLTALDDDLDGPLASRTALTGGGPRERAWQDRLACARELGGWIEWTRAMLADGPSRQPRHRAREPAQLQPAGPGYAAPVRPVHTIAVDVVRNVPDLNEWHSAASILTQDACRSEERRVGKECR